VLLLLVSVLSLELRDLRLSAGGLTKAVRLRAGSVVVVALTVGATAAAAAAAWAPLMGSLR
jgi:hypothetical protein